MSTWVARGPEKLGPFDDAQLASGLATGAFTAENLGWQEGMSDWQPLRSFIPLSGAVPPPLPAGAGHVPGIGDDAGIRMLLPVGRSGWAIAAGYLGLFALVIIPAPLALIVSIIALRDLRKSRHTPNPKYGMGRAVFGLVTGLLGTLFLLAVLIAGIAGAHH